MDTYIHTHNPRTTHTHIHIRAREHRRCSFRLQSERVQALLGVRFLLSTIGWCAVGQMRIYQQCVDRNTGAYCHPQHPEEFPESCRDLDYSQMGVPEAGLGILLSILRKGLTGNKRMPEKKDAVLRAGVPKLRVRHTYPSVGVGSSRVSHNKSYLNISPTFVLA